jgi:arylsulfatase A-like enzyme
MKDYYSTTLSLDRNIGKILTYLDKNDLTKNTIVVYTSDQGFYMGEHGWFDKRFMYEESMRTPLIIRYPGMIKPGTVSNQIISNVDFAPTFLEIAGLAIPKEIQGNQWCHYSKMLMLASEIQHITTFMNFLANTVF